MAGSTPEELPSLGLLALADGCPAGGPREATRAVSDGALVAENSAHSDGALAAGCFAVAGDAQVAESFVNVSSPK